MFTALITIVLRKFGHLLIDWSKSLRDTGPTFSFFVLAILIEMAKFFSIIYLTFKSLTVKYQQIFTLYINVFLVSACIASSAQLECPACEVDCGDAGYLTCDRCQCGLSCDVSDVFFVLTLKLNCF